MINEKRIVDNFLDMVKIPSPSLKERAMADCVKVELEKIGLEVTEDNAGESCNGNAGNIIGVLKAKGSNKKKILFEDKIFISDNTKVLLGEFCNRFGYSKEFNQHFNSVANYGGE